jgi:hypothetical protein
MELCVLAGAGTLGDTWVLRRVLYELNKQSRQWLASGYSYFPKLDIL